MSSFSVEVLPIRDIQPIDGADRIEVVTILGYQAVVPKGKFSIGEQILYIPEAAVVPENILRSQGLWSEEKNRGRLAGSSGTRLVAIHLRGVLSQGLVLPIQNGHVVIGDEAIPVSEGDNAERLGIVKYQPEIPSYLAGEIFNSNVTLIPSFDLENIKKFPDVFQEGEEVTMEEKIHGTFMSMTYLPVPHPEGFGHWAVSSRGHARKGLAFKNNEKNAKNSYVKAFSSGFAPRMEYAAREMSITGQYAVMGELYGKGIQDLTYGLSGHAFRGFEVYVGEYPAGRFLNTVEKEKFFSLAGMEVTPVLYRGPFSMEAVKEHTSGMETISGKGLHIREGVVIRRVEDRAILKSISPDYLLRKGGTEYI